MTLDTSHFEADLLAKLKDAQPTIEEAMAKRFHEITLANFGIMGPDRPTVWPRLSDKDGGRYIRKVGREIATLVVTGRLRGSVHQEGNEVFAMDAECPYVLAHQYGSAKAHLPPRPFFPIDKRGKCMPWTLGEVTEVAQKEINHLMT
jgi:phage gpG-like protein